MTPEASIKAKIKRRMEKLAARAGLPLFWDTPPAGQYGAAGRPDHTVRIGRVMFHIEAKAQNSGKPTKLQAAFHQRLSEHGEVTLVVAGEKGVDSLYDAVIDMLVNRYSPASLQAQFDDAATTFRAVTALAREPVRNQPSLDLNPGETLH